MIAYPLQVGAAMTRVIEAGTGGMPVIFIHGVSAYAHRWLQNLEAIGAAGFHAYAIDLPGHGFASKGGEFDYSIAGYAAFVGAFMDKIGAQSAILIGTSLGGHIAGAVACRSPERVQSLVLIGSLGLVEVGAAVRRLIAGAILKTDRGGIREKLQRAHADPAIVSDEWVNEEFHINNSAGAKKTFERLGRYIDADLDRDCVGGKLAALSRSKPTLLVWGEHDRSVGLAFATAAHRALPGSWLVVIKGAGHAPYFERPPTFNGVIAEFLGGALDDRPAGDVIER